MSDIIIPPHSALDAALGGLKASEARLNHAVEAINHAVVANSEATAAGAGVIQLSDAVGVMDGLTLKTPNREPLQKSCSKNSTY